MKGFNGDSYIKNELNKLINKFGIKTIFETGTYMADSTKEFSTMAEIVFTIENNENYYNKSLIELSNYNNVRIIKGSSPLVIKELFNSPVFNMPVLFFLDAHWYSYNPLIDELKEIARTGTINNVIAIHDFKVPNKDFGFDTFPDGTEYKFEIIKPAIDAIYGRDNYHYYYNEVAEGSNRGIIYIHPKI
jgi:hypothetical protein